jgi:carboxymethylenebutenolidase
MIEFDGIRAYLADSRAPGPGVVVLQEWWGLVPHILDVADRFASAGFTALAPDLYRGATAGNHEPDLAEKLMMELNPDRAIREVGATIAELRRRGFTKVATVGFCLGGALSLAASAKHPVDATVAFYGIWPGRGEDTIRNPILVHVAEHEEHNPPALPENFPTYFEGMDNVEIHIYPETDHAFFNDTHGPDCYDEANARLAWDRTIGFLRRHLS